MSGSRWLGVWAVPAMVLVCAGAAEGAELRPMAPSSSSVLLEWNGASPQPIHGVEGGGIRGVVEKSGQGALVDKRIAGVGYDDVMLQAGFGSGQALFDWVNSSWMGKSEPANGAILFCNSMGRCIRKEFMGATLSEVTVPALDASSKDKGYLAVSLHPKGTKLPREVMASPIKVDLLQKPWLAANFRLAIDGLDCSQVRKIDSFTVKQGVKSFAEFPDLQITMGMKGYEGFRKWFEAFVVSATDTQERNGEIVMYAPDLQTVLGKIRLIHLGITGLDYAPATAASSALASAPSGIATATAQLYCERMELVWGGAGSAITEVK